MWMDERWETGARQCSAAQQFVERLIFLVFHPPPPCPPRPSPLVQAGLVEQRI